MSNNSISCDNESFPCYFPLDSGLNNSTPSVSDPTLTSAINTHTMQTSSKYGIFQHQIHLSLLLSHFEPTSVKQVVKDKNWQAAMQQEFDALISQRT